jgi:CRP-like cAMP-binding protein
MESPGAFGATARRALALHHLIYIKMHDWQVEIMASMGPGKTEKGRSGTEACFRRMEESLSSFPLLATLDHDAIGTLARTAVRCGLPNGKFLFRQGGLCSGIHLVVGGQIKLSIQTEHGSEKVIGLVGTGQSLGELALLMSQPYMMSAQAVADSEVIQLAADAVLVQIQHNGEFLRSLLNEVCRRLTQRTRDLESHLLLNGTQRVIGFLLSQLPPATPERAPDTIMLPAKKSIIASRLNVTQEHFSRILHDLQGAGMIAVHGREIHLLNLPRLRALPDRVNGGLLHEAS